MCTRFVYNGDNTVVGFNFDIDLSVWTHTVIAEKDRFFIGIKMPDNQYHSFHGINRNGNVGTLLYVNGNKNGEYRDGEGYTRRGGKDVVKCLCILILGHKESG